MNSCNSRRQFLLLGGGAASAMALGWAPVAPVVQQERKPANADEGEVTPLEDLMREHGVIRRALLVYVEAAARLRRDPASVSTSVLQSTARLFRKFGEDYHEKQLEEAFILPEIKKLHGSVAADAEILIAQHARGREITDFILATTTISSSSAATLADALDAFNRMYANHAAREDTIVFPAWKSALSREKYKELGDRFEEIETRQLGEEGYEHALDEIAAIEKSFGLEDLAQFTAPSPARH
jgi:hemerythrin-like domain-containing protein